jgi:hypothetical protein
MANMADEKSGKMIDKMRSNTQGQDRKTRAKPRKRIARAVPKNRGGKAES